MEEVLHRTQRPRRIHIHRNFHRNRHNEAVLVMQIGIPTFGRVDRSALRDGVLGDLAHPLEDPSEHIRKEIRLHIRRNSFSKFWLLFLLTFSFLFIGENWRKELLTSHATFEISLYDY